MPFSDVPAGFWAASDIVTLYNEGIFGGYPDGAFRPNSSITRAEIAVLLARALGFEPDAYAAERVYDDVPANHWAFAEIAFVTGQGLMGGYGNGTFRPDAPITREELVKVLALLLRLNSPDALLPEDPQEVLSKFLDRGKISDWAESYVALAVQRQIVTGMKEDLFEPDANATRAQTARLLYRLLKQLGRID
jgi:hypothetical protein